MDEGHRSPRISVEGSFGILLALIGIGGAGALFVLPHPYADYVGWSLIGIAFAGAVLLAIYHVIAAGWLKSLSLSRTRTAVVGLAAAAAVLGFDYWYSSNYSTNGGIWHIQIGIQPVKPNPPPPPLPPPPPAQPWVTQDEIDSQQKLGHQLIKFSPEEILGYWVGGQNIGIYMTRWIKVDYPAASTPTPETLEKKDYYVVQMNIKSGSYFTRGSFSAYFDPKKWGDRLINLRQGERLKAYCQFQGVDRTTLSKDYGGVYSDKLIGYNCDLP
jgi:hypothetical protein